MGFFVTFLFIVFGVVVYVWFKNKEKVNVLSDNGDLNEPLNPDIHKKIVIPIPKMFHPFLQNKTVKQTTDIYLPDFLKDSFIEQETSPLPDKFTATGAPGYYVYTTESSNDSENRIQESSNVEINAESIYLSKMCDTVYHTPSSSFEDNTDNTDNMV